MSGENEQIADDWGPRGRDRSRRPVRLGFLSLLLIVALAFAAAYVCAPWFAFRAIRAAAQNQDIQALGGLIDYNAVRASMQVQLRPTPQAQVPAPSLWKDPLGAVRRALEHPTMALPPTVEDSLTPDALARMADGLPPHGPPVAAPANPLPRFTYWDQDRARIAVADPKSPARRTVFTFQRRALFTWVLVQIRPPPKSLG